MITRFDNFAVCARAVALFKWLLFRREWQAVGRSVGRSNDGVLVARTSQSFVFLSEKYTKWVHKGMMTHISLPVRVSRLVVDETEIQFGQILHLLFVCRPLPRASFRRRRRRHRRLLPGLSSSGRTPMFCRFPHLPTPSLLPPPLTVVFFFFLSLRLSLSPSDDAT